MIDNKDFNVLKKNAKDFNLLIKKGQFPNNSSSETRLKDLYPALMIASFKPYIKVLQYCTILKRLSP